MITFARNRNMQHVQDLPSESDAVAAGAPAVDRRRIDQAPPQQREALVDRLCETLLARLGIARVDAEPR
jgi:hypothetical protein